MPHAQPPAQRASGSAAARRLTALLALMLPGVAAQQMPRDGQPAPGRWLVTFAERPVPLDALQAAIRRAAPADEIDAIVRRLEQAAAAQQQSFAAGFAAAGARATETWWLVAGAVVELEPGRDPAGLRLPGVARIWPDCWRAPAAAPAPIKVATDAAHHGADGVQASGVLGAGVSIAILDTGQDAVMGASGRPHRIYFPDGDPLRRDGGGIGGSRLLANHRIGYIAPEDWHGHGTQIAAIAAGERWHAGAASDRGHAPRAGVVGYSLPDFPDGLTLDSTLVRAWQQVLADRAALGIAVANLAYYNQADPTHPTQQALDETSRIGDVLVASIAGNTVTRSDGSPSNANGLAVGAVTGDQRQVTPWSTRGPLHGDPQRYFPDLVAQGDLVVVPKIDDEQIGNEAVVSGTSFATPQVAGAALLYRGLRPRATALETKAAILATLEDVAAQNPTLDRNGYGLGYLRDDRLIEVARGDAYFAEDRLTRAAPVRSWRVHVERDVEYTAVLTWHRHVVASRDWSDLNLEVRSGTTVLARSATPRNLYERVRFRAPAAGHVDVVVQGATLEVDALPYALVVPRARNEELAWLPASSPSVPPPVRAHVLIADTLRGRLLRFGGETAAGDSDATWLFDGAAWSEAALATKPPARRDAAAAFDGKRGRIVLFGGRRGTTPLGDHWEWDGGRWTARSFATMPAARAGAALAWDPQNGVLWLHGGQASGPLDDLWQFDGTKWTRFTPTTRPAARSGHRMAWDPSRDRIVLFGGSGSRLYDTTWSWNGANWSQLNLSPRPPARHRFGFEWDPARGCVVLAGGSGTNGPLEDVWDLAAGGWYLRDPVGAAPARSDAAYAFLPQLEGLHVSGGASGATLRADHWCLRHQTPATVEPFGVGCGGVSGTPALDVAPFELPHLDRTLHLTLRSLPKQPVAFLALGNSNTQWQSYSLPLDLTGHGMPGCRLHVSLDLLLSMQPDAAGIVPLALPPDPSLAWRTVYLQLLVGDPAANAAGWITSNALALGLRLP